jgi:hypothetical protein
MNRKEQTRYKNGRSDWTRKETLKAKKGKLVEAERYVEENFVSVENAAQNYKTTERARVTYDYKFNKKWYNALEVFDPNNAPEDKRDFVSVDPNPQSVYIKDEMPVVIWPGKWDRALEITFEGDGSTPAEMLASLQAEAFPYGYQQFFLDEECTQPVPADISIRDWNNIEKLYIGVPVMLDGWVCALEYVTNKYTALPAHRAIVGARENTVIGRAYMDYAGRGYKTVSKPSYANEWIVYDATSPKEGNKMSGDSYDMHGLEIMIYESIRENTNVYSCIECFFHFSL